jgi:PAS domain S-box-containing protein
LEIDFNKTEHENLISSKKDLSFLNSFIANVTFSSSKHKINIVIFISLCLIFTIFYLTSSISLTIISILSCVSGLFLGTLITGHRYSTGLEIAKLHLEETSEALKLSELSEKTNTGINITGIPLIDSFYEIAENAALAPEHELQKLKEELSLVLNNIAAAVLLYAEDGSVQFCSPYIQVLTGFTKNELETNNYENENSEKSDFLREIIVEEDWQRYKRARLISHLGEDSLVRFRVKHKSGLILWLESRMVPIINTAGEVQSVMTITIDVTDSINYQKQIEQQNQDLNDFAYMVSHDLKAPIFTIHGMADALRDDYSNVLPFEAKELLIFITDAAKRLDKLVASVLEYSALSNANETHSEIFVKEIIDQVLSDHKQQLMNINNSIIIGKDLPLIKADPIRIYQVFSNLIGNSIKYKNPEKSLKIIISHRLLPPNLVEIEIQDNGLGIPKNKLNDIFRPYRRAHGADIEGSGVGLACVKKIIEKLGGQVRVQSIEGEGSSFFVTLPLSKPARRTIPEDLERLY